MNQPTTIYLMRHGEPVIKQSLIGLTDTPLSETGWQQMQQSALSLPKFDLCVSSSLSRCAAFAQEYCSKNNIPLIIQDIWRECFFGDWDGISYQQLAEQFPTASDQFFSDPWHFPPPKSESLEHFKNRVLQAFTQLIEANQGKTLLICTHVGVIRVLLGWALSMPEKSNEIFQNLCVDYASTSMLQVFTMEDNSTFTQVKWMNRQVDLP